MPPQWYCSFFFCAYLNVVCTHAIDATDLPMIITSIAVVHQDALFPSLALLSLQLHSHNHHHHLVSFIILLLSPSSSSSSSSLPPLRRWWKCKTERKSINPCITTIVFKIQRYIRCMVQRMHAMSIPVSITLHLFSTSWIVFLALSSFLPWHLVPPGLSNIRMTGQYTKDRAIIINSIRCLVSGKSDMSATNIVRKY